MYYRLVEQIMNRNTNYGPDGSLFHKTQRLYLASIALLMAIIFTSCKENELGKTIEIISPSSNEFRNLEWSPSDRFQITFEVSAIGKEIGDFEIALGRFSSFDNWRPDEIIQTESFSSKKSETIVTISWILPDTLTPSSEDNYYKIIISGQPKRAPVQEGGNSQPKIIKIVARAD